MSREGSAKKKFKRAWLCKEEGVSNFWGAQVITSICSNIVCLSCEQITNSSQPSHMCEVCLKKCSKSQEDSCAQQINLHTA